MQKNAVLPLLMGMIMLSGNAASGQTGTRGPLPPWYPPLKEVPAYEPDKLMSRAQAVIDLASGSVREEDFNQVISLNGTWKFSGLERGTIPFADDADRSAGYEQPSFDDAAWDVIPVPQSFYLKYKHDVKKPYVKGWYRRQIAIPSGAAGKSVLLHFGVIGYDALLFINGKEAGRHHGDFTPWTVDISGLVEPGKNAVIAIRVFSDLGPNAMAGASDIIKTASHGYGSQYSPGNIKGGIWRSAELRIEPAVRIAQVFINPDLDASAIDVVCRIDAKGAARTYDVYGAVRDAASVSGAVCAPPAKLQTVSLENGRTEVSFRIPLKNPKRWSPDSPALHHLTLTLVADGRPIAVKTERFGFRSFRVVGDEFRLNGKRIYLFGESLEIAGFFENGKPEIDQPDLTASARARAAKFLLDIKAGGAVMLRLSEQPAPEAFLDLADEIGIMIYDMWAWSYNDTKITPSFEKINAEEVTEWIERDYNHPSVAMWLGGNEVKCDSAVADIFSRQSKHIRSLDRSGRPVSVFSGAASGYADAFTLDTDLLDLHSYNGLSGAWSTWDTLFNATYRKALSNYAKDTNRLAMPYIIWELVGFSWGARTANYVPGDVDMYLKWAKGPFDWAHPNGIGWAGSIGLDAALDKNRGALYAMATMGRRIMGKVREDERVSGFAPWFTTYSPRLPARTVWNQPVYCSIRGIGTSVTPCNIFSGEPAAFEAYVVNTTGDTIPGAVLAFTLAEKDGSEAPLGEWKCGTVKPWERLFKKMELGIPASSVPRWAQLRMRLISSDGKHVSQNFIDLYIADRSAAHTPLDVKKRIGVLACGATGEQALTRILGTLALRHTRITGIEGLGTADVIIIPPSAETLNGMGSGSALASALTAWVKKGGTLLVLEQAYSGGFAVGKKSVRMVPALRADLVVPAHPAFAGLSQENFEYWSGDPLGYTAKYVMASPGRDIIVARPPYLTERETYTVLSDGVLGSGRLINSQFDACARWDVDSAATVYLRNLLAAACSPAPNFIKPCDESGSDFKASKQADFVFIDLSSKANMGFRDETAGDGTGGWTDQGDNDFRMMPVGRQHFRGIAFDIIDPEKAGGKSCIVLGSNPSGDFRSAVEGIPVNRKLARLFFLHGEAFVSPGATLSYTVHYDDGTSVPIVTEENITIADWWSSGDLPGAKLAFTRKNMKNREVGLMIMEWENPFPGKVITAISAAAPAGRAVISMIAAITGEAIDRMPVTVGAESWTRAADAGNGNVLREGPFVPGVKPVPDAGPDAVFITMPGRGTGEPTPVLFRRFLQTDAVKKLEGRFRYLVFDLKGASGGEITIMLPDENFKRNFKCTVPIEKDDAFHTVRIPLDDMPYAANEMRGECYIFNGLMPCSYQLRNIRLE